ncbi:MAG: crotonase/enoyl-CoA hydratase family protein [Sphingomonadaceae bacterium]
MSELVTIEREGAIAVLTLNRPEAMNALGEMGDGDAIAAACAEINEDTSIRAAILTGAGRAFSAGGDLKAMLAGEGNFAGNPAMIREGYRKNIHKALRALHTLDVPLIAAINGAAIGLGCDLACLADIRIASNKAVFGVTFLKIGLVPGDGGTWILPRIIGMSRAAELFYTGRVIKADQAAEWGLISRAVDPDALMDEAKALATEIAEQPPHQLRATKAMLRQGQSIAYETALEMAASTQGLMHHTEDHKEGVRAILDKRTPEFRGE